MAKKNEARTNEPKEPYEPWLSSEIAVQKLKTRIEKVGFPLEVMARNVFEKRKYYINSERHYEQRDIESNQTIQRETDIHASREFELNLPKCTVEVQLKIIAECKYSSINDFLSLKVMSSRYIVISP